MSHHPNPPQVPQRATPIPWEQEMLEGMFDQGESLCRGQEWGISEGCDGIERVEPPWCAGDPSWTPEGVENPSLGFVPCPSQLWCCGFLRSRFMRGKTRGEGHAANGVLTQIFAFISKKDLLRRAQSPGNDPKHVLGLAEPCLSPWHRVCFCRSRQGRSVEPVMTRQQTLPRLDSALPAQLPTFPPSSVMLSLPFLFNKCRSRFGAVCALCVRSTAPKCEGFPSGCAVGNIRIFQEGHRKIFTPCPDPNFSCLKLGSV